MAFKKRQHFVPRFLLRRFAQRSGRWQGHIFRLEVGRGRVRPAVPRTEAAKNRYYDLPEEVAGAVQPEDVLQQVESRAATTIARFERREVLRGEDLVWLAYFAGLQTKRTPLDRDEARYLDEVMARELEELRFSAPDRATAFLRAQDPALTEAEAEAERQRILADLAGGRIRIKSSAEREVASMFIGLNESVTLLTEGCDWTLVDFAGVASLVLPDTGYTRYDPHPRVPGSGSGFLGSGTVETAIPVSPTAAVVITRGTGRAAIEEGTAEYAADLNMRAYAQAQTCIYGRAQHDVVAVHQLAKKRKADVAERRRRPRTFWILERRPEDPQHAGVRGIGYSIEGVRIEWFEVDPRAYVDGRPLTAEDMWR